MPELAEEKKIKEKLEYIGLDLENIPEFLKEEINFKPLRIYENKIYRVYKYVPINKIKILLTSANRLESLSKKQSLSSTIKPYICPETEEDFIKHATFLKMVNEMDISKIEETKEEQDRFKENIPFKVKYNDNYLWQIYCSNENEYFMIFSTEELNTSTFFYLLKEKIKCMKNNENNTIFVPVVNLEYSGDYLKKSEFLDIEKYLWLFTKEWPFTYEVYDINGNKSIQIIGNTIVYEKIKSYYKIILNTKENASKFYNLLKALFILQTELPHYYNFETKISSEGGLEFLHNTKLVTYENLSNMIKEEYKKAAETIQTNVIEKENAKNELDKLNKEYSEKNKEYLILEKRLTTYLECRKTFFGRVRYFFKSGKKTKIKNNKNDNRGKEEIQTKEKTKSKYIQEKEFYTIEDLLIVVKDLQKIYNELKNVKLDLDALNIKNDSIKKKIENANQYIKEIENHKKSIFEFWKFANKDEKLALNSGDLENEKIEHKKIEKTFDYEEDINEIGIKFDNYQRKELTKEECNSIYIFTTNILKDLNKIKQEDIDNLEISLEELKHEAENERSLFLTEEYDIFGNISEDKTKIKSLGNTKHRENKKDKIQILDITKNTTVDEYIDSLKQIKDNVLNCLSKLRSVVDIDIYMASDKVLNTDEFGVFCINPEHTMNNVKDLDKINLYKVHIKENMPIIAFSNIIYYDNNNKTLPLGMNVSDSTLIDMSKFSFELKRQKLFRMNQELDEINSKIKIVCVYEYDLKLKKLK